MDTVANIQVYRVKMILMHDFFFSLVGCCFAFFLCYSSCLCFLHIIFHLSLPDFFRFLSSCPSSLHFLSLSFAPSSCLNCSLLFAFTFAAPHSPPFPNTFSLPLFLPRVESYQTDVERHCEETGVLLHHWRHQQLRHAEQR
ncbi:hypothetical protein ILYODFUR_036126 [Ilyodon furcidens]|uniref:Transmembrane protein n=1 Tax=Ilyodon furcidens TaxID=33524 RepID=A0ABV0VBH5_9TELE